MKMVDYANHRGIKAHRCNLPLHIAIIMDGNGRWAASKKLSRTSGHRKGGEIARDVIFACQEKGIKALTLFAFGVENWKRPAKEVRNLFRLFFLVLRKDIRRLHENNIRLRVIGDRQFFNPPLLHAIEDAENLTKHNTGLCLNIAVNYSGRWDILQALRKSSQTLIDKGAQFDDATETVFTESLSLAGLPEPDLFIRTGGVKRISNFMLWELAYTELYFTPVFWPEFTIDELDKALLDFAHRERRFGLTSEQLG
jgi:undecaprenyl diphosphate synthase